MKLNNSFLANIFYKNICSVLLPVFSLFVLSVNCAFAQGSKEHVDLSAPYAIVIASSTTRFSEKDLGNAYASDKYRYYTVKVKSRGKTLNQLRYGFFKTSKEAKKAQEKIKIFFNNKTVVTKTKQAERNISSKTEIKATAQVNFAEHLILSTTYKAANTLADAAGDVFGAMVSIAGENDAPVATEGEAPKKVVEKQYDHYLVLNLKTTNNLSDFEQTIKHPEIANNAFYISELKIDGSTWYQYRLGFFVNSNEARAKLEALLKEFPLARIIRVTREEKEDAIGRVRSFFSEAADVKSASSLPKLAPIPADNMRQLLKKGSKALSDKKYKSAIKIFTKLLRYPENRFSMDAQEFLGFAYELNGDVALARVEYGRYLSLYPESSGAGRVRQRLASLLTARVDPRKELRERNKQRRDAHWEAFSSFSQFYRRDDSKLDNQATRENLSLLSTDASVSARYRGENYLMNSRFIGGQDVNFTDGTDSSGSISSLYFNVIDIKNGVFGAIGRQNISKDGVLGRMDGMQLSYTLNNYVKLNTVAGFVVENTQESANSDKSFMGISADLGTFMNAWDFNVYYIRQNDGKIVGREAVGSEVRYFHPRRTLFTLVDYDIMFKELNTLLAIGNWQFENRIQMNATVDVRKSPFLTTSNALQGRTEESVDDLLKVMSENDIRALAKSQTASSKSFLLGINSPINDQYQISGDVTLSKLSSTIVAGQPVPGTDDEYFYNLQLIGNSVFMNNDSTIFGYRFSDTDRGKTNSLSVNMRFPLTLEWRMNPRLRFDDRKNSDGSDQTISALALRFDYRLKRNLNFELDFGIENSNRGALDNTTSKTRATFLSLGYRYDF